MENTEILARISMPWKGSANRFSAEIKRGELMAVLSDQPVSLLRDLAGRYVDSRTPVYDYLPDDSGEDPRLKLTAAYTDGTTTGGPFQSPGHVIRRLLPEYADMILDTLRLRECEEKVGGLLTTEQRFRFELAKVFAADVDLVLLDLAEEELPGNADIVDDIWMLATKLSQTVIIATGVPALLQKADRIIMLENGICVAFDTPDGLRLHPTTPTAGILKGRFNCLSATVTARGPANRVGLDLGGLTVPSYAWSTIPALGEEVMLLIAPEEVHCSDELHRGFHLTAVVSENGLTLPDGQTLTCPEAEYPLGEAVSVWWDTEHTGVCAVEEIIC